MESQNNYGKNAFMALAYLKSSEPPIKSISQLLYYCMATASTDSFTLDDICRAMSTTCKLQLPIGIIKLCLSELKKMKYVAYNSVEKTYSRTESNRFDLENFESKLMEYNAAESTISNEFLHFVKSEPYNLAWTLDNARHAIQEFLTCKDNAVSIFIGDEIKSVSSDVKSSWYFAAYLDSLKSNSPAMLYVHDLSYGYAKCIGLLGSADEEGNINISQRFTGTEFYFDTKLVLRYLGYSYDCEVSAVHELVDFIRSAGGRTRVFHKNLIEIGGALNRAAMSVKNEMKYPFDDIEMGYYISDRHKANELLEQFSNSMQLELLENLLLRKNFSVADENDAQWRDRRTNISNIDIAKLEKHISEHNPKWNIHSIENDVDAINRINRLRHGNYKTYFGGKQKLPVFVTTNNSLIHGIVSYGKQDDSGVAWEHICLPVISDTLLSYSLWIKGSRNGLNMGNNVLSKMTFALNHSSSNFRAKLLEDIRRLQTTSPEMMPFKIETAQIETINDVLKAAIPATEGNVENITPEIIIASETEAIKNRTYQQQLDIDRLADENEKLRNDNQATEDALKEAKDKLRTSEILTISTQYMYTVPFYSRIINRCAGMILPAFGLLLSVLASIISLVLNFDTIGICLSALFVVATTIINRVTPAFKNWISNLHMRIFENKLQKHIQGVKARISVDPQYLREICDNIYMIAYQEINHLPDHDSISEVFEK